MNINKTNYKLNLISLLVLGSSIFCGCKKFTDIDPPTGQLVTETTFKTDATLKSALAGMYSSLAITNAPDLQLGLSLLPGLSADEMSYYTTNVYYDPFFANALNSQDVSSYSLWRSLYANIYQANAIISGVAGSTGGLSNAMKVQATGEAKFIRAFCYFYLVNLWGDVPLAMGTDAKINNDLPRSPKSLVYTQIISDLTDAKNSLAADFSAASGERIRPNKYAAAALLSRCYLYTANWADARANADLIIALNTQYSLLSTANLSSIFTKNNTEAIWQVTGSPAVYSGYTYEGYYYSLGVATIPNYLLTFDLINAFETGDARLRNWVGVTSSTLSGVTTTYYYPFKYRQKVTNATTSGEYCTYLRLAEQYLIRAEALAQLDDLNGAVADLNIIRRRAGLSNTTAVTKTAVLRAIAQERRVELFSEYGARWNDLKRTGTADDVLSRVKPGWKATAVLYPIPLTDIRNSTNLTQNAGY